jgi:hypothetical protein
MAPYLVIGYCSRVTWLAKPVISDWVFEQNAAPLMQVLPSLVGYERDQWDRERSPQVSPNPTWNPTIGSATRSARMWPSRFVWPVIRELRSSRSELDAPDHLHDRLSFAITIAQEFELKSRR